MTIDPAAKGTNGSDKKNGLSLGTFSKKNAEKGVVVLGPKKNYSFSFSYMNISHLELCASEVMPRCFFSVFLQGKREKMSGISFNVHVGFSDTKL